MPPEQELVRLRTGLQTLQLWPRDKERQQVLASEVFGYLERLQHWNRRHNLTAVRDPAQMLVHHVLDCAAVVPVLRSWVESRSVQVSRPHIIDVGSGAGLPGIVLAWFWPEARITLVEPAAKRVAFLQQATATPALAAVEIIRARIEELAPGETPPDAIICRAFSSLADFARAVAHLVGPATVVAAMKGRLEEHEKLALTSIVDDAGSGKVGAERSSSRKVTRRKASAGKAAARSGAISASPEHHTSATPSLWEVAEEVALQVPELDAQRCLVRLERARRAEPSNVAGAGEAADLRLAEDRPQPAFPSSPDR